MFKFCVDKKDDHAVLYFSSEVNQYPDENTAIIMTAFEVLDVLEMRGLIFALKHITIDARKRALMIKEQARRLLRKKQSLPHMACAELIDHIIVFDGVCNGFIEIPTDTAFALIDKVDGMQDDEEVVGDLGNGFQVASGKF